MSLRQYLDKNIAPHFEKGGKYEKYYVFYEMFDTMLYSPPTVTHTGAHVRDAVDLKRIMMTVWFCAWPAMLFGIWNVGFQANSVIAAGGHEAIPGWRSDLVMLLTGFDPGNFFANFLHGLVYYVPILIVTYVGGLIWEGLFAWKRGHEVNEGFFVTGILFTLILPPTIPLWLVFLGISFGVVIGKEVFGGTGKNFLNPALVGRAFLFFAYPAYMSGDMVWSAVDNFTGATALSIAKAADPAVGSVMALEQAGITWMDTFFGNIQGSIGEVSTAMIAIGAIALILTKVASWRIMAGVMVGMVGSVLLFNNIGSDTNAMFDLPWYWHLTLGGFAFGMVFMATDPVSAAMTDTGKWIYGAVIGFMVAMIRVVNPAYPEGMMLAILFGNLCAPIIDYYVMQANIKRRAARHVV
ncbi:MAG: NADH:ubiquinone reductase (Na(+)-transporting) subunit B [Gammaproteobacteria bacterium]